MTDEPRDPAVPLSDVEVAQRIAAAAREGGQADRTPTVDQVLAAFKEDESGGADAIQRVSRALALAGVDVSPPLEQAAPGSRVTLDPGRGGSGGGGGRRGRSLLLGLLGLAIVIAGFAAAAIGLGGSGDDDRASSLPAGATTSTAATGTGATTATGPTAAEQAKADAAAKAEADAAAKAKADQAARSKAYQESLRKQKARRAAEAKAASERAAARKRQVTAVLTASPPSYACIDNGAGNRLFGGTLSGKRTFKARRLRLNIGLNTVRVTVDGKRLTLSGSPSGYLLQAGKAPVFLPLGRRPSC